MKKVILKNGLKIILAEKETKATTISINVKAGSNNETQKTLGISHFIEHMLFEGTKKRNSQEIVSEIEKIGGEINAATSNNRTLFYIQVPTKYTKKGIKIISDIIQNPLFDEKSIEKERKVIINEIKMVNDEPRFYQWILFTKTLFKKHPAHNPVYGKIEIVNKLSKKDLFSYYKKYYCPNNMVISIVGKSPSKLLPYIKKQFENFKTYKIKKPILIREPKIKHPRINIEKGKTLQSYTVIGYKTVARDKKESYSLDILENILGKGQSSKLFTEIRSKLGLVYEIGVEHESNFDFGFFAAYANTNKKNLPKVKSKILEEFKKIQNISAEELKETKESIIGSFILENEDDKKYADNLGFLELVGNVNLLKQYPHNIRKVTLKEIRQVAKKYLNKNYTQIII